MESMLSESQKRKVRPWLPFCMSFFAFFMTSGVGTAPFLGLFVICFFFAGDAMLSLRREIAELREEIAELRQKDA
jgi:hypothetical protein